FAKFKAYSKGSGEEKQKMYLLLAYFAASSSIYIHNFVDISIFFVSTGFYLALFNGAIFALAFGPLDKKLKQNTTQNNTKNPSILFYTVAALSSLFTLIICVLMIKDFYLITLPSAKVRPLLFIIYWLIFISALIYFCYVFLQVIFKTKKILIALILAFTALLNYFAWGFFKADFYLALATSLAQRNDFRAIALYERALKANPLRPLPYQFKGVLYATRLDMLRTYRPLEGDKKNTLQNDFERGLANFMKAKKHLPNSALLDYNIGVLYKNAAAIALRANNLRLTPAIVAVYEEAIKQFEKALQLDPVYDNIYFQLANIAMDLGDYQASYNWVLKYTRGPNGITNQEYLARHKNNQRANTHLAMLERQLGINSNPKNTQKGGNL
ncbi:MAG: tetratricopeptide repeat protein, partial [Elusimicrobiota bacterium]|nr:tetratricopeptide repeat protein [Elusimicrobiota bacterium]